MELEALQQAIAQGTLLAAGLSLLAGLVFSLNPLALAALPIPLAYLSQVRSPRDSARYSLMFVAGMLSAHALLGFLAGAGGHWVQSVLGRHWGLLLGPWLIVLGLLWLGWLKLPLPAVGYKARRAATAWGAFALGIPFSVVVCPFCSPALVVLLGAAAGTGSPVLGAILLTGFALGRALPLALMATAAGGLQRLSTLEPLRRVLERSGGAGLVLTGLYLVNAYFMLVPSLAG
ncbi:cytochrome c biogenesis CcdA family protein [Pseudomonas sp. MBLB4123]|uniref:cytochrome c biogenesis CcdA family protein n=1 Tax=Pseudomonas sp. MBLB4123 TaxID=3451557 RepID=UPI003F7555D9